MFPFDLFGGIVPLFVVVYVVSQWIRIINEYERGVVFRLGRVQAQALKPGLKVLLFPPLVDRLVKVDMRTVTLDVPPQDVITKDNITVRVSAVVYYKVTDAVRAVTSIENYGYATSQIAQTVLRSIVGQFDFDSLLSNRDEIGDRLQSLIDTHTDPWGIKVSNVDIKDVEIPADMQRALARQAEAERERRAKIISAEGEFQAAEKLIEAAKLMEQHPMALQMRYLQTLMDMSPNNAKTIVFPLPMNLLKGFEKLL